jgi:PEP-CTERM motif
MSFATQRRSLIALGALAALSSAAQAQTTWWGFEGTSQKNNFFLDGAFRPPDTMGAVGTTQFMETSNGSVAIYNKSTGALLLREKASDFWIRMGLSGSSGDQRILFDHYTNRWIVNGFCAATNEVCIGVSDTADALGTWKGTKITAFATGTADYPTLSVTQNGVLIGTNNFTPSFSGTSLFSIPKADLFGGAPTVANMSRFNATGGAGVNDRGFSIQGATNWTGETGNTHNVFTVSNQQFDLFAYSVNGVNAAGATQTAVVDLNRPGYTFNGKGRQPDTLPGAVDNVSNRLVDALDDRVSASVYQVNGKIYGIHTVTPTGVAAANAFTELRYYVLDAATFATLSQGTISGGNFDYYQGSLAVNADGDVVIGFNRSGSQTADLNADGKADGRISFMGRVMKDNGAGVLSQVGTDLLFRVSDVGDYRCGAQNTVDTVCRQRWGDYAAVTLDPTNSLQFYAIGEYAANWDDFSAAQDGSLIRANWHTYVAAITVVPEPGTYGLMALGLFVVGVAARRRSVAPAAR